MRTAIEISLYPLDAEDPLYFEGQHTGSDAVLISDLPYHGTTECEDRTARP